MKFEGVTNPFTALSIVFTMIVEKNHQGVSCYPLLVMEVSGWLVKKKSYFLFFCVEKNLQKVMTRPGEK